MEACALHTTVIRLVGWPCVFFAKVRVVRQTSTKALYLTAVAELKMPLLHYRLYIQSSAHRLMWWMMRLPEYLCSDSISPASSAFADNSIYTTHCAWSQCIYTWACVLLLWLLWLIHCEFFTPHRRYLHSSSLCVSKITFRPTCWRVAYSARLKTQDLHLEDNRCLICAVMWDEVNADGETVMNLYEISGQALPQSQVL